MPPRSVKMKRRILGFQRRVWWPKWTPASSSSRIETTDTVCPPCGWVSRQPAEGAGAPAEAGTATRPFRRDEERIGRILAALRPSALGRPFEPAHPHEG